MPGRDARLWNDNFVYQWKLERLMLDYWGQPNFCVCIGKKSQNTHTQKINKNTHGILILLGVEPNHKDQLSFSGICILYKHIITQLLRYTTISTLQGVVICVRNYIYYIFSSSFGQTGMGLKTVGRMGIGLKTVKTRVITKINITIVFAVL